MLKSAEEVPTIKDMRVNALRPPIVLHQLQIIIKDVMEKKVFKLYQIPNKSKIYEKVSDGSKYFIYDHPDGMYSYCVTEKGGICHLSLSQELVPHKDGYKFNNQ